MAVRWGAWRDDVWDRIGRLSHSTLALSPDAEPLVRGHVDQAAEYANESWRLWFGRRGSRIEAVWRELRLAEEAFLEHVPDSLVWVKAEEAVDHGRRHLGADDPAVKMLSKLLDQDGTPDEVTARTPSIRSHALQVLIRAHEASDRDHRSLRAFGLQMMAWIWFLTLLAIILVVFVRVWDWQFVTPPVRQGEAVGAWQSIALAMGAGMFGAMFTAVPSIWMVPDKKAPFNPVTKQAVLKMVVGAWSGFVGLVAVSAGLSTGAGDTSTIPGFVMVAAIFGAGQEAVTRFTDKKAADVRGGPGTPAGVVAP